MPDAATAVLPGLAPPTLADEGRLLQRTAAVLGISKAARATIGFNSARRYLLARAPTGPRRRPVTPTSSTLAEIEAAIAHDEATLAGYRSSLAKREAKGHDAAQARELVRTVERRLAMLRERRQIARATEGPGEDGKGPRPRSRPSSAAAPARCWTGRPSTSPCRPT